MKYFNIPIFVPHEGCPFNCTFCNQRRITGADTSITKEEIEKVIKEHLKTLPKSERYIEAAFFGGSFTGISSEKQCEFLGAVQKYLKSGAIDGIRLSTRPDYISEEILERLKSYGVTTIELGVQSMDKDVLFASARGHSAEDVENAVRLIRQYPFRLGLQMMTGLPGDTYEKSVATAEKIIGLRPDFVRIYPTLVIKDTPLEKMYESGKYRPQSVEEAVKLCKKLIPMFRASGIDIIRVSLVTTDEISENGSVVAGPYHPAFRELAEGEIYFDEMCGILDNNSSEHTFVVNTKEVSRAVGYQRKNICRIKEKYGVDVKIKTSDSIERGRIKLWKE